VETSVKGIVPKGLELPDNLNIGRLSAELVAHKGSLEDELEQRSLVVL